MSNLIIFGTEDTTAIFFSIYTSKQELNYCENVVKCLGLFKALTCVKLCSNKYCVYFELRAAWLPGIPISGTNYLLSKAGGQYEVADPKADSMRNWFLTRLYLNRLNEICMYIQKVERGAERDLWRRALKQRKGQLISEWWCREL